MTTKEKISKILYDIGNVFNMSKFRFNERQHYTQKTDIESLRDDWSIIGKYIEEALEMERQMDSTCRFYHKDDKNKLPMKVTEIKDGVVTVRSKDNENYWAGTASSFHECFKEIK